VRALSSKAKGSFLILEYQKSSAALSLATQLVVGGKCLTTNTAVRSWVRVWWVGDDFWYSSMRSPPTTPSPSELSKKIAPQFSEAIYLAGQTTLHHKPPKILMGKQIKHLVSSSSF